MKPDPEIIFGRHPVRSVLDKSDAQVERVWVQRSISHNQGIRRIVSSARTHGAIVSFVDKSALDRISQGGNHQGIVLRRTSVRLWTLNALLEHVAQCKSQRVILALDQIQDPQNLGTLFRSATAAGVSGVIVGKRRSAPFSATAMKASAGTLGLIPAARVGNLSQALQTLKKEGFWIVGISLAGERMIFETRYPEQVVIVLGNEGSGIRPIIEKTCDEILAIPMKGPAGSINVSAAGAVTLYELVRSRYVSRKE